MRGHVVGSFCGMAEEGIAVGNKLAEIPFEVMSDARIGILTQDQRCTCVMQKNDAKTLGHARVLNDSCDLRGDLIRSPPLGGVGQALGVVHRVSLSDRPSVSGELPSTSSRLHQ